eukprot:TRINITY_DN2418_c0_g1_i4.p1 TRINITY_DN2418_c0_g1~~TRINITY_DN2418_c0_g1_i4.p1  ORF type:complete len:432 (-),score=158.97 TRINITY_DN2418_c0_g1_i4:199-1494(-)
MASAATIPISKWHDISKILGRKGPLTPEDFSTDVEQHRKNLLEEWKVLVIGAGGLGCELLKNLAYVGFRNIEVIDMDTIDYSNLNRQFLFRKTDVGSPKSVTAANFINKRFPGVNVIPHFGRIEEKDDDFYRKFKIIIAGLDSIPARRWINAKLVELVERDDEGEVNPDTVIPFIDGGTEGFKGQARVIFPTFTSCFECSLDAFPPQTTFAICTIANTPRLPEHCIEWAHILEWPKVWGETKFDADNTDHMKWMFDVATKRAAEFNISGVTYRLTQGVVKNIIPAIASTNAIIAAAESNEAFKIVTECSSSLDNYMMYNGVTGVYTYTFEYEKKEGCLVCGTEEAVYKVSGDIKLEELMELLAADINYQLKKPSLRCNGKNLYMQAPKVLQEATAPNLAKQLKDLFESGSVVDITDPVLSSSAINLKIVFV